MTPLDRLLDMSAAEIERRCRPLPPDHVARTGAAAFSSALESAQPVSRAPSSVPVADRLGEAPRSPLADALRSARPEVPWIPSHRMTDGGHEAALAPLNEVRDLGEVVCGLVMLAPQVVYPLHSHEPQELYLPMAGDGMWRYGGSAEFRALGADPLVYNHPNDLHSIAAGDTPLVAMYVLWS